jgi:hypothetical protein
LPAVDHQGETLETVVTEEADGLER